MKKLSVFSPLAVLLLFSFTSWTGDSHGFTSLRIAVISDLNGSYGSTEYDSPVRKAVDKILELNPDLVITTGDMVAGEKSDLTEKQIQNMWSAFRKVVTDPLHSSGIPFAVTPGNHDASAGFPKDRGIFKSEWFDRRPDMYGNVTMVDSNYYPFRYAFTMGNVLFISIDATDLAIDTAQRIWLENLLEKQKDKPVKIVFGHLPLIPIAQNREDEYLRDNDVLNGLFVRHGVSLYINGHHHAYYPGKHGDLRLLSMPCLGDGPRKLIGDDKVSPKGLVLLNVSEFGVESIEALKSKDNFTTTIDRKDLPQSISFGRDVIVRDDL